jgi:hypothetical protein
MDYENTIYFIVPNPNSRLLSYFKDKHLKALVFSTLFYEELQQFSYQQTVQWNHFINPRIFQPKFLTIFFKDVEVSIQKVIGLGWV